MGPDGSGLKILLVDDNETGRYAMSRMLRHAGFTVIEAATGYEALRLAGEEPNLIILDVKLPDISGFDVCQRLKATPTTAMIPVLQISAVHIRDQDRVLGLTMGADSYLTGPIDPSVLLATIQALLRVRQIEMDLRETNKDLETQRQALEQSNHALEESEGRLRLALDAAGMGTWEINTVTDEERWSPETEALWNLAPGSFAGTSTAFLATVHPEDRDRVQRARTQATIDGVRERLEYRIVRPDGTVRWVLSVGQSFSTSSGWAGKRGVVIDITERKLAEEAQAQLLDAVQRANSELQQFAHIVSHDLNEPLRTVTNYVQLLELRCQGKLDTTAQECIAFAVEGTKRMQQLLADLLAYTRIDNQERPFALIDCETLLVRTLSDLHSAIVDSGAEVTHDPLPTVYGDGVRLGQVFQNLIGNALKFHGAAPPRIHISAHREDQQWRFSIRDHGIGFDPKHADRIFQIFQRLHTRKEYTGTGIGLAICKKIIDQHGGRIWVESTPGQGATFWFVLPAGEALIS